MKSLTDFVVVISSCDVACGPKTQKRKRPKKLILRSERRTDD